MGLSLLSPVAVLGTGVFFGLVGYFVLRDGELPGIPDQYWGPSSPSTKEDSSIRPFQINIPDKVLTDFKSRLDLELSTLNDRIADSLEGVGFEYGMNKNFLRKVASHWKNSYDWRAREKLLNKYPSFKTRISGIDIHFQHVKPRKQGKHGSRAILLLHGWPGSIVEFQPMIPLFQDPKDSELSFEVVIPSLPGFGFSDAAKKPGLGSAEMSPLFLKLMNRLGYEKFYVHGGDWGSLIASNMGTLYKDNVLGIHMTMCQSFHPRVLLKFGVGSVAPFLFLDENDARKYSDPIRFAFNLVRELGYMHIQATKPDTIGVALSQSPLGHAAYILEKHAFFTNDSMLHKEDGGILSHFDLDKVIDNLMVYWFGKSITPAMRIYKESLNPFSSLQFALDRVTVETQASCLNFPAEPLSFFKFALLEKYPKLRYTHAATGGHFNAMQVPDILANDIIAAVNFMDGENRKPKPQPQS